MLILFDPRDRDDLSTRGKIVGPIVSLVQRFHCMILYASIYMYGVIVFTVAA